MLSVPHAHVVPFGSPNEGTGIAVLYFDADNQCVGGRFDIGRLEAEKLTGEYNAAVQAWLQSPDRPRPQPPHIERLENLPRRCDSPDSGQ